MTTDVQDPRKVRAIIENVKPHKGDHRIHLEASFPLGGNGDLVLMLLEQQGNPIELTISQPIQLRLDNAKPPETETVTTSVDGEPAKVTRTKRNGTKPTNPTAAALASMQEAQKSNHMFVPSDDNDVCGKCGYGQAMGIHVVPTWSERYQTYLTTEGHVGFAHAQNAAECARDDADNGYTRPMTEDEQAFMKVLYAPTGEDAELTATARALIDAAGETEANPEKVTV